MPWKLCSKNRNQLPILNRLTDVFAAGKFGYGVMVQYQNLTRKPELFRAPWARAPLGPGSGTMYPPLAGPVRLSWNENCRKRQSSQFSKQSLSPFSLMGHESWVGKWPKECDHKRKRPKWGFYKKSKELHCLTRCVALKFEDLSTSNRYFSELKDLSLDGLAM